MKKFFKLAVLLIILCNIQNITAQEIKYSDSWGNHGFYLENEQAQGLTVNFSLSELSFENLDIKGEQLKSVKVPGIFLPNDEGAPDLAGTGRFIAIPQGATASFKVTASRTETIKNIEIAPAPRIPLDTENGPLQYEKDLKIFAKDAFYPENPVKISSPTQLRGVDVVMLGITPFQYNPVKKELIIYRDLKIEIMINGGTGYVGDDRLRSRWWDPIITDAVLNPNSIPEIDYGKKKSIKDTPDYEYLIITPNDPVFLSWADSIKTWRTLQGIRTGIVTTTDIGGNTTTSIKNYINNAYNTWDFPPAAVLLLADYNTGTAGITSYLYTHPAGYPNYASDNYFADVTGDDLPDVVFARITANNNTQLQVMISKFLNYERNPPTSAAFYNLPITALGWQTERWFQICSEVVGGFWKNVQGKNPVRINAIYSGTPGTVWSTATNTATVVSYFGPSGLGYIPATPAELGGWSGGTAQGVVNAINAGSFMLQHRDHGFYEGWGEPAFTSSNINSLTNVNNQLPFIFSINCQTGAYHNTSECFAEKFHRWTYGGQNSGALGLIAATEVSYSFVNDAYVWGLFDNLWPNFMPAYGTTPPSRDVLPAFGNAAGKYFLYQSSWPYNTGDKLVTYRLFHHHGDAFMTVYSEVPQNLTVNHNAALIGGLTSFTVTANNGSFIALTVNGQIIGTTNGTGSPVIISIPPQTPGNNMIVTVTKQNYYRYSSSVPIIPPTGPYMAYETHSINDVTGNNNGFADYGETVGINMTLKNLGSVAANNVTTMLICNDPYLTFVDNTQAFGTIASGATATINNAYAFTVANNVPDQRIYNFELQISGISDDTWTSYFSVTANAPLLEPASSIIIDDLIGGNGNNRLDPGETATITAVVSNNGHSLSPSASALLTSASPYITVNLGSASLGQIAAGSSANAVFEIYCDPATPIGQPVDLAMNVSAGNYGFNHTYFTSVGLVLEDWETGDFSRFPWTFSGNAPWVVTNTGSYEGVYTAKSGTITHNQTSEMSVLLQVTTAGNITFYRKTSSESGYDYLRFYIDGVQLEQWAGETPWGQVSYAVTAGNHTFKWTYYKDGSVNSGSDCVWVDYIVFPPSVILAPEISTNPDMFSKTLSPGGTANDVLNIANTGNIPLDFSAQVVYSGDGKSSITVYPQNLDYRTGTCTSSAKTEVSLVKGYPTTQAGWMTFDVSGIPDGAIINSVEFHGYVNATYYPYWNINPVTSNPLTASAATLYADIIAESSSGYYLYRSESSSYSTGWKVHTLGGNVNTDLQNALAQDWFAIGIMDRDASSTYYIGFDGWAQTNKPYLVIDYTYVPTFTWLKINGGTAVNGSVAAGSNQNINVSFDAGSYPVGTYNANIKITSNDADEGTIFIPCTMVIASGFNLNLTAMLEGPFNGINMNTMINGIIPLNQPYNTTPWNYNGTESVASIPANVVDWVLVELRDATSPANATPATRIARQAGFMMGDGSIVATDGVSPMIFSTAVTNGLYVVLHHRGHLSVMSASALVPVGQVYSHNFSTEQAYGTSAQCLLAPGVYGLRGGDANRDGEISTADMLVIWNMEAGTAGYLMGDFNLDGQVDNKDKDDCWAPNYGLGCQVPE